MMHHSDMRQYSFDTLRIVCLRNEDNTEDDDFFVDILADGVSTRNLSEEKRDEAARFVVMDRSHGTETLTTLSRC